MRMHVLFYISAVFGLKPFIYDQEEEAPRCLQKSTYVIDIYIHIDKDVAETLSKMGTANGTVSLDDRDRAAERKDKLNPAVRDYINSVITGPNDDLEKHGVQLRPFIIDPSIDTFADSDYKGSICESPSSVSIVTENKYSKLAAKYENNTGINLFIFSCISKVDVANYTNILVDKLCGRTIGVLWRNNKDTAADIKNGIIQAIAGHKSSYEGNSLTLDFSALCMFGNSCIGSGDSNNRFGKLLDGAIALVIGNDGEEEVTPPKA